MVALIQPSFGRGEITPEMYGRVDTSAYQIGLRTARNLVIHAQGGASNRPGTTFLAPQRDHTQPARLIEFQFKTTDTYMLVFEDGTMRVIRNDALVTDTSTAITGITQASPGVVTSVAHGLATGDDVILSGIEGMTRLNERVFRVTKLTADTFSLKDQVTGTALDTSALAAYTAGGTVRRIYTKVSPYAYADLAELKFVQSADVMTLTNKNYPVYELTRIDHDNWTFTAPTFAPAVTEPTGLSVTVNAAGTTTVRYAVTSIDEGGKESLTALSDATRAITGITQANPAVVTSNAHGYIAGDEVEINSVGGMTELNGRRFTVQNVTANTFELEGEDSSGYTAYTAGGTANATFFEVTTSADTATTATDNDISWTASADAVKYSVYKRDNGLYGLIGETEELTFKDDNIDPNASTSPPRSRNPFLLPGQYPGTASYFEQRRLFGGSLDQPDTNDYSRPGDQSNFSRSTQAQSDDAITETLAALRVNEIRHYVPGNDLLVLTSGSEWRVNSGSDAAFEASTLRQKPQSYWGCSHIRPLVIGNTVLYIPPNKSAVRTIGYSFQIDGYTGNEVSIMAAHLFRDHPASDWAFSRVPDPIITLVRDDGQVLCLTFNQEQEMVAWTHWDTLGKFEAVSSLPQANGEIDDAPYFVVRRTVNGNTVRYIERLHSRRFADVRDCFFVDCGLSYDAPVDITSITSADPIVITADAHGFSNGDQVDIFDVVWTSTFDDLDNETQPDQLNTRRYYVVNATANTFEIAKASGGDPINASDADFPDGFSAYVEGGTVRRAVTTVSALDHLEGCEVVILADGNVISGKTVSGGSITLSRPASRVHVGLKMIADLEPLDLEPPGGGTVQGLLKRVIGAVVRFNRSRGLFIGPNNANLVEMKQRENEAMGDPTALLTGDKEVTFDSEWGTDGRMFLRQRYPLPFTVLAIVPRVELSDPV